MGVSHTVIPLAEIPDDKYSSSSQYFGRFGIQLPQPRPGSRQPTMNDLKTVLETLDGFKSEFTKTSSGCDVRVSSSDDKDYAVIWVKGYANNDNEPISLYFHRGSEELATRIVKGMSERCGPFLLMINEEEPRLVGI